VDQPASSAAHGPARRGHFERVERVARHFHEAYERLAPSHGYETRKASAVPWEDVPYANRSLMLAVVAEVLAADTGEAQQAVDRVRALIAARYPESSSDGARELAVVLAALDGTP
jgi:hypothetical protein